MVKPSLLIKKNKIIGGVNRRFGGVWILIFGIIFLVCLFSVWRQYNSLVREAASLDDKNNVKDVASSDGTSNSFSPLCDKVVNKMLEFNIRLIALDFDMTIVDIHTSGKWRSSSKQLSSHVRPGIKCLINASIHKGLLVAVASFSKQEDLIKDVINDAIIAPLLATTNDGTKFNNTTIVVFGGRNRSEENGKREQLNSILHSYNSQQQNISSVTTSTAASSTTSASSTILIDDDKRNIRKAHEDGYYAVWFNPKSPKDLFDDILTMERPK